MFDLTVENEFKIAAPEVLYHYTKWDGAAGILKDRAFWATAHDCTNDKAELVSADAIIMEVARDLRKTARGAAAAVLDRFLEGYPTLQVTKLTTVYLACFSAARDDKEQWREYADNGRGVCLGVRLLNEPAPKNPDIGTVLIKVDYSETSWRAAVTESFTQVCSLLARAEVIEHNVGLGLSALYRSAAFESVKAKQGRWAVEQEFRQATLVHRDANVRPNERVSAGKTIRYLPIVVRRDGKLIALAEIIIGPNQNTDDACERLKRLLADAGYRADEFEYPEITVSTVPSWDPACV